MTLIFSEISAVINYFAVILNIRYIPSDLKMLIYQYFDDSLFYIIDNNQITYSNNDVLTEYRNNPVIIVPEKTISEETAVLTEYKNNHVRIAPEDEIKVIYSNKSVQFIKREKSFCTGTDKKL